MSSEQSKWMVSGVCCTTEEHVLRKSLDTWLGPDAYAFNPVTCELTVAQNIRRGDLLTRLRQAGFDAKQKSEVLTEEPFLRRHRAAFVTLAAAAMMVAAMIAERLGSGGNISRGMLLAAIALGGWKIAVKAFKAVRLRSLDMNVLMTVAVCGAVAIGKWDEGAAVIVLFSVALMLESYSVSRARKAVTSLMAISPEQATVVDSGVERAVPARALLPGAVVVVRPGDRIPIDGKVIEGRSEVNESPITGESSLLEKMPGSEVYAGTINQHGMLMVKVTKRYEETTLAGIVHLIESAQESRAPVQQFVERFAGVYTPVVFVCAFLVALVPPLVAGGNISDWLYRALVMLVIACPCALVISTPLTFVSAMTGAARHGILIKGGKFIEALSGIRAIAFDKTGTVTEGRPGVTDVVPLDSAPREQALRIIAALERHSEHHLAPALLAEAARFVPEAVHLPIGNFEALPGQGVRGTINGTTYFLGNERLCLSEGCSTPEVTDLLRRFSSEGKTAVVLGSKGRPLCVVATEDGARHQSRSAIAQLRKFGIRHLVMLSGDHAAAVDRIAEEVGLERSRSGMLPHEKSASVTALRQKYGTVAMVGDGINDGPALAAADIGIAMGVSGTDTALEAADVVLMSDDLSRLPLLIGLSRKAMRIIRQNITVAMGIKLVFLLLTLGGMATLWMALLADDGAALIVILNGLRALVPAEDL